MADSLAELWGGEFLQPGEALDGTEHGPTWGVQGSSDAIVGTLYPASSVSVPVPQNVRQGVTYGTNDTIVGVLNVPIESVVLLGVGYGANETELQGQLKPSGGSGPIPVRQPVLDNGQLCSPLWRGDAYTTEFGNAFVWRVKPPTGLTISDTATFTGYSVCDGKEGWNHNSVSITEVTIDSETFWDIAFDLDSSETLLIDAGFYVWRVDMEKDTNRILLVESVFEVQWV